MGSNEYQMHTFSTTTPITTGLFFWLCTYLMKPTHSAKWPETIEVLSTFDFFKLHFNFLTTDFRGSAHHRECIPAHRWQILLATVQHDPITIAIIVEICVNLHSFLRLSCNLKRWHWQRKCQPPILSGSWRTFATVHNVDWTTVTTSRIPIGTVQL